MYGMYARSDRGCKGELAQSLLTSPWEIRIKRRGFFSLEAELKQAKREITDLTNKIGYLKNHYTVSKLDEDVFKVETETRN